MEGFTYVDIFATKGIEYLLVISFLMVFVLYWRFLTTPSRKVRVMVNSRSVIPSLSEWFYLPLNLYYHQGHTWALPEDDEVIKVGINDFAGKLFGKINTIKVHSPGTKLLQGEPAMRFVIDGKEFPVLSPVSGEVVALNEEIEKNPEIALRDPYDKGWIYKVKTSRANADLKNLLTGKVARAWIGTVLERLREMGGGELGLVYQDGGFPVNGIARALNPNEWEKVVSEFLLIG